MTRSRYLPSFTFQDPIVKVGSLEAFALNLRLLRTVFDVDFELHSCRVAGPTEIVTRCAYDMEAFPGCSWLVSQRMTADTRGVEDTKTVILQACQFLTVIQ